MPTVLVVGEAMIELTTIDDRRLSWTFAGDTLNCAAALAAAAPDLTVRYLTGIGDDPRSLEFVDYCAELGIDASESPVVAGRNLGLYWITTHGGEPSFRYWRSESAARHALGAGIDLGTAASSEAIVLSGITLAVAGSGADALLHQIDTAGRAGALVAYDANYRGALWPDCAHARSAADRAVALADVVVASADDVRTLWEETPEVFGRRMAAMGVGEAIVTDAASSIIATVGGETFRVEPPVVEAVDATGAGDAFFGTYLGYRLVGTPVRQAIDRAVEVAAVVVGMPGALTYLSGR